MSEKIFGNFDWELYDNCKGNNTLIPNNSIIGTNKKNICFSREPYAQKLFNIYTERYPDIVKKDLKPGDVVRVINIYNYKNTLVDIELSVGLSVTIDLLREKKFLQIYGYNSPEQFIHDLQNEEVKKEFINRGVYVYIIESSPALKVSLWNGHLKTLRNEFLEQIENPTKFYIAKIVEANKGGFFVDILGLEAFMPGSLAAPNKILNFQSYIGKEVPVMIEDYLKEINSFIVSHKKYLSYILPIKIHELDLNKKYIGTVTGYTNFGIFLEFDEIYTGLLHTSKMDEETKKIFESKSLKPGDKMEFYISEITKDNRIILTKESPEEKLERIQKFILESKDKIIEASISAIMNFGAIISINDLAGLVPLKEFKKYKISINNYVVGDKINVIFDSFLNDKLIFKLAKEKNN